MHRVSAQVTPVSIGDHILAFFYGEWHPGVVRAVSGDQVTVWWDAEPTQTIVPIWEVCRIRDAGAADGAAAARAAAKAGAGAA